MTDNIFKFTNSLIRETSPYLLQHAHNPVNWMAWNDEAFVLAKKEDKPVLVSIGYSACHWCHVMEHESFEDEKVAKFMNENFVCIKVDREERPDVDTIYMDAVQGMIGSGGWPLNVFLTPERKPFYGGTYFPPQSFSNRPSWLNVLESIHNSWLKKREAITEQSNRITDYLNGKPAFISKPEIEKDANAENIFAEQQLEKIFENLKDHFDTKNGGYGNAPKFPSPFVTQFLLRLFHFTKNNDALNQASLTLDKMCRGGIYDQLGGGLARYSTDAKWLAPHFEKMLYDNALFVITLCEAYQITKSELYEKTIRQTLEFINRELINPDGGFYSALDADSEGEEGKFYVWTKKEVDDILLADAFLFEEYFDITDKGNWEEKNILHCNFSIDDFAKQKDIDVKKLKSQIEKSSKKLFSIREKRIRPALDDKIILCWNALMISAFATAFKVFHENAFKEIAKKQLHFLLTHFRKNKNESLFYHNYKNGNGYNAALLDDYSCLIKAMLDVYEISFDEFVLKEVISLTDFVNEKFLDPEDSLYFYSMADQTDLIARKKDFYDGVIPSGNSIMASNLQRLTVVTGNEKYRIIYTNILNSFLNSITNYPSSFANFDIILCNEIFSMNEIVIVGNEFEKFTSQINSFFIPNKVIMASLEVSEEFPLLADKSVSDKTLIYLCKNYSCQLPVDNVADFIKQLSSLKK
jgi:uncharacterized protein